MLGLTLLIFIVPVVFNKPLNRANVRLSDAVKQYTAALKQTFLGIDVVKNFGSEERTEREIARINETLCKNGARQTEFVCGGRRNFYRGAPATGQYRDRGLYDAAIGHSHRRRHRGGATQRQYVLAAHADRGQSRAHFGDKGTR